jgi:hypothetical protein
MMNGRVHKRVAAQGRGQVTDRQSVMKAIWQEKRMVADRRSVNLRENRKKAQVFREKRNLCPELLDFSGLWIV